MTVWNEEVIFDSAAQYYDDLIRSIEFAQNTIELTVYIFAIDDVGSRFLRALEEAAIRGVRVRVSIDGVGSAESAEVICQKLDLAGAEVKIFHPLPWYLNLYRWSLVSGNFLEKFIYFISSLNRRDHRKFCVIDNQTAWCGNLNICVEHLGLGDYWRDYSVRISGSSVVSLKESFDAVWYKKLSKYPPPNFNAYCCNYPAHARRLSNRQWLRRINRAQHKVWICSAYFSPTASIHLAITKAVARGVDVRIIVAGRSDVKIFPLLSSTYYADLIKCGVKIFRYQAGILHAKVLLVDEQCVIGSSNLNYRSFYHDLELDVVLSFPSSLAHMHRELEHDVTNSVLVLPKDVDFFSRTYWFGWLPRLLRYWM